MFILKLSYIQILFNDVSDLRNINDEKYFSEKPVEQRN